MLPRNQTHAQPATPETPPQEPPAHTNLLIPTAVTIAVTTAVHPEIQSTATGQAYRPLDQDQDREKDRLSHTDGVAIKNRVAITNSLANQTTHRRGSFFPEEDVCGDSPRQPTSKNGKNDRGGTPMNKSAALSPAGTSCKTSSPTTGIQNRRCSQTESAVHVTPSKIAFSKDSALTERIGNGINRIQLKKSQSLARERSRVRATRRHSTLKSKPNNAKTPVGYPRPMSLASLVCMDTGGIDIEVATNFRDPSRVIGTESGRVWLYLKAPQCIVSKEGDPTGSDQKSSSQQTECPLSVEATNIMNLQRMLKDMFPQAIHQKILVSGSRIRTTSRTSLDSSVRFVDTASTPQCGDASFSPPWSLSGDIPRADESWASSSLSPSHLTTLSSANPGCREPSLSVSLPGVLRKQSPVVAQYTSEFFSGSEERAIRRKWRGSLMQRRTASFTSTSDTPLKDEVREKYMMKPSQEYMRTTPLVGPEKYDGASPTSPNLKACDAGACHKFPSRNVWSRDSCTIMDSKYYYVGEVKRGYRQGWGRLMNANRLVLEGIFDRGRINGFYIAYHEYHVEMGQVTDRSKRGVLILGDTEATIVPFAKSRSSSTDDFSDDLSSVLEPDQDETGIQCSSRDAVRAIQVGNNLIEVIPCIPGAATFTSSNPIVLFETPWFEALPQADDNMPPFLTENLLDQTQDSSTDCTTESKIGDIAANGAETIDENIAIHKQRVQAIWAKQDTAGLTPVLRGSDLLKWSPSQVHSFVVCLGLPQVGETLLSADINGSQVCHLNQSILHDFGVDDQAACIFVLTCLRHLFSLIDCTDPKNLPLALEKHSGRLKCNAIGDISHMDLRLDKHLGDGGHATVYKGALMRLEEGMNEISTSQISVSRGLKNLFYSKPSCTATVAVKIFTTRARKRLLHLDNSLLASNAHSAAFLQHSSSSQQTVQGETSQISTGRRKNSPALKLSTSTNCSWSNNILNEEYPSGQEMGNNGLSILRDDAYTIGGDKQVIDSSKLSTNESLSGAGGGPINHNPTNSRAQPSAATSLNIFSSLKRSLSDLWFPLVMSYRGRRKSIGVYPDSADGDGPRNAIGSGKQPLTDECPTRRKRAMTGSAVLSTGVRTDDQSEDMRCLPGDNFHENPDFSRYSVGEVSVPEIVIDLVEPQDQANAESSSAFSLSSPEYTGRILHDSTNCAGDKGNNFLYSDEKDALHRTRAFRIRNHEIFISQIFLPSPYVVRAYGYSTMGEDLPAYVMEYCEEGSIHSNIFQSASRSPTLLKEYSWTALLKFFNDLAKGMAHLHKWRILHRDVKPSNFLIGGDGNAKVSDFGLAMPEALCNPDSFFSYSYGNIVYAAPEVLRGEGYWPESDVYSFGVSMWEALTRNAAHSGLTRGQIFCRVATGAYSFVAPALLSPSLREWLSSMLEFDKYKRPSFAQIADFLEQLRHETDKETLKHVQSFFAL